MKRVKAKLLYPVKDHEDRLLLNMQSEAGEFMQIEMTENQLVGIVIDGVKFLFSAASTRQGASPTDPAHSPHSSFQVKR